MKKSFRTTVAAVMAAVLAVSVILAPTPASAKWNSSDIDDASNTSDILMYSALACAGIALVIAFATHDSKPAGEVPKASAKTSSASVQPSAVPAAPHQRSPRPSPTSDTTTVSPASPGADSRLNLYIGLTNDKALYHGEGPAMDLSDYSIRAGVTFGF